MFQVNRLSMAASRFFHRLLFVFLASPCAFSAAAQREQEPAQAGSAVKRMGEDAERLQPLIESEWVREWARSAGGLPPVEPFEVTLGERVRKIDEELYYVGRYGSPLAYSRALDLAAAHGLKELAGKRILDFGYGSVGQLQMMALSGAEAVGVDVAPLLPLMYEKASGPMAPGSVRLVNGQFPADAAVNDQVGGEFDLIISKNTLKRGYIHPAREAPPEQLIQLGVDDGTFLREVHARLKPGGLFVIYNLCPAKAADDQPYIPWADGESPFAREQFEAAGLEVLALDIDDSERARAMAGILGWGSEAELGTSLFAWVSVVKRPAD